MSLLLGDAMYNTAKLFLIAVICTIVFATPQIAYGAESADTNSSAAVVETEVEGSYHEPNSVDAFDSEELKGNGSDGAYPKAAENVEVPENEAQGEASESEVIDNGAGEGAVGESEDFGLTEDFSKADGAFEQQANDSIASVEIDDSSVNLSAKSADQQEKGTSTAKASNAYADTKSVTSAKAATQNAPSVTLKAQVHVQNIGWQGWRSVDANANKAAEIIVGTEGRALRLEAIQIQFGGMLGSINYQVHVQNIGWQDAKANGEIAGTSGQSLRLEAVRIALLGDISKWYDIEYKAHVQNEGWEPEYKKNGSISGTSGKSLRLEALRIRLVPKKSP